MDAISVHNIGNSSISNGFNGFYLPNSSSIKKKKLFDRMTRKMTRNLNFSLTPFQTHCSMTQINLQSTDRWGDRGQANIALGQTEHYKLKNDGELQFSSLKVTETLSLARTWLMSSTVTQTCILIYPCICIKGADLQTTRGHYITLYSIWHTAQPFTYSCSRWLDVLKLIFATKSCVNLS